MNRDFPFAATPAFVLDQTAVRDGGSRLLSHEQAKQLAADDAANANDDRPRYGREVEDPAGRFGRWTWWVWTEVGSRRETVVGPNTAWTKRAADRRSYRHESRLIREAADR